MRGPVEENLLWRRFLCVAVLLDPVEPPVERPNDTILADRVQPPFPRVKQTFEHDVYNIDEMYFLLRLLINAAALWVAIQLIDGIDHRGSWWSLIFVALVFGVLNASVRPLLKLLSLPMIILTLGLFIFVINALMLLITGWLSGLLNLGFHVDGFWDAFFGGLIVSVVSFVLSLFMGVGKTKVHVETRELRR